MTTGKAILIGYGVYAAIIVGGCVGDAIGKEIENFKRKHKIGDSWYEKNDEIIDQVAVELD